MIRVEGSLVYCSQVGRVCLEFGVVTDRFFRIGRQIARSTVVLTMIGQYFLTVAFDGG